MPLHCTTAMLCVKALCFAFIQMSIYRRVTIPAAKRAWSVQWPDYAPIPLSVDLSDKSWADPDIRDANFEPKWNQTDGAVDRRSHEFVYSVVNGYPLNPMGRTGACLRGRLGRWGPNHATDAIVTKWKRDHKRRVVIHERSKLPVLQFVAIRRSDTKELAIPGGMIDAGEDMDTAVKGAVEGLFMAGVVVFAGVVTNDPRNTDNAWMETVVKHFHDDSGRVAEELPLAAGDDAVAVQWVDIESAQQSLYANHIEFIKRAAERVFAHFE